MRMAFCVSGGGALFRAAVSNAQELAIEPVLLITERKASTALTEFARQHGITEVRLDPAPREEFDRRLTQVLTEADPDLTALTFDRILPPPLVAAFAGRIINVHPALLPSFPGTRAIERLMDSGARFGGATIHEVVDEVDVGPIVAQAVLATIPDESLESYGRRMYALLEGMFLDVLRWYAQGAVGHDASGRVVIQGARYGTLPVSPSMAD